MSEFSHADFSDLRFALIDAAENQNEKRLRALLSNNLNVILAALAAAQPSDAGLVERETIERCAKKAEEWYGGHVVATAIRALANPATGAA